MKRATIIALRHLLIYVTGHLQRTFERGVDERTIKRIQFLDPCDMCLCKFNCADLAFQDNVRHLGKRKIRQLAHITPRRAD